MSELGAVAYVTSDVEQKRALIRGLPYDYDVTAEAIVDIKQKFLEAVAKLITREMRLLEKETTPAQALVTWAGKEIRSYYICGKHEYLVRDCRQKSNKNKKGVERRVKNRENRKCFKSCRVGHIAEDCRIKKENGSSEANNNDVKESAMITILSPFMSTTTSQRSRKWMADTACTPHITIYERLISDFTAEKEIVHVRNEKTIPSFENEKVCARTVVGGRTYWMTLHDVIHAPDIVYN